MFGGRDVRYRQAVRGRLSRSDFQSARRDPAASPLPRQPERTGSTCLTLSHGRCIQRPGGHLLGRCRKRARRVPSTGGTCFEGMNSRPNFRSNGRTWGAWAVPQGCSIIFFAVTRTRSVLSSLQPSPPCRGAPVPLAFPAPRAGRLRVPLKEQEWPFFELA